MNNIGLIDVDGHNFPNLALMKISAYHKLKGNRVNWVGIDNYDIVYASKVFSFTPNYMELLGNAKRVIKGGIGYNNYNKLPYQIEHIMPDYSLYKTKRAYGFLTRGCPNKCSWCIVPKKEGDIVKNADITEFWSGQNEVILLDNNVLASDWGLKQIEKIIDLGIKIDFNQGLDARLIANNKNIAELLSKVKWIKYLRMACDTKSQIPFIKEALSNLNRYGFKSYKTFIYVLVTDIDDAHERVMFIKDHGSNPFAQPYRDFENNILPTKKQRQFARWVNNKAVFKTVDWKNYKG